MERFAWMLLTVIPLGPVRDRVDVIERNVVYCEADADYPLTHKPIFTQILFRSWEPSTGNHEIIAWRMLTSFSVEEAPEQPPEAGPYITRKRTLMAVTKNQQTGLYELRWLDNGTERIVEAKTYIETMTLGDAEVEEREVWPREKRRELLSGKAVR